MRLVIQRVNHGSVTVDGEITGQIAAGLVVLVGFHINDEELDLQIPAKKLIEMRIFANDEGRFDHSVADIKGGILLVPQFTLLAETNKGRRPDFANAMKPPLAKQKFQDFTEVVTNLHQPTATAD